jgi:catechol 2,3-dioxygenase-like lactoylglutathione lyase family enzyme
MSTLKTHVALNVSNIEKSVEFYHAMLGVTPVKNKGDYAKFDLTNPPLNLTLNLSKEIKSGGALSHLGIQVESSEDVKAAIERFQAAGLALEVEDNTECCYALQDKVWVTDPDGNRWEVFVVKVGDTSPEKNINSPVTAIKTCCA